MGGGSLLVPFGSCFPSFPVPRGPVSLVPRGPVSPIQKQLTSWHPSTLHFVPQGHGGRYTYIYTYIHAVFFAYISFVQVDNRYWKDVETSPFDAILLVKQWASDTALSQPPLLLLPASVALGLCPGSLKVSDCHTIKMREYKELEKTAEAVKESPWNLHRAAAWLREYISQRSKPDAGIMPKFVFSGKHVVEQSGTPLGWNMFAPGTVQSKLPCMSQKRPAEAVDDQSRKKPKDTKWCVEPSADDGVESNDGVESDVNDDGSEPVDAVDDNDPALPFDCACGKPDGCIKCWRRALTDHLAKHSIEAPKAGCTKCVQRPNGCKHCIKKMFLS